MVRNFWFWMALAIAVLAGADARAVPVDGFGAMGASETAGTDYTGSWVPYLANQRGFNFGGAGQPWNVAVGGATSATLLTPQHQHETVRDLVANGSVDLAYLSIGANDFNAVAASIANGTLTGQPLINWAQGVVNNINTATDTVLAAHPLGMIVAGVPDILLTPNGRAAFNTPDKQLRGTTAINLVNSLLKPQVLGRGLVYVDLAGALRDVNAAPFVVGGVTIDMINPSADPTHFFQDGLHPAAVGNGFVANLMLAAVNVGYGTAYSPLSDLEILTTAGLASSYTGPTSAVNYAHYITVPEPSTLLLAAGGLFAMSLLLGHRVRRLASAVRT